MITRRLPSKTCILLSCMIVTACVTRVEPDDIPDFVLQHTLSSLTSEQSFAWKGPRGQSLAIRPLGTFRSGDYYCRDYQIETDGLGDKPLRRTACRFDKRWTDVDPTLLDL
ncbi:MAG: hypothetical protein AAGA21_05595 [Pseudomonadota bacterium]